MNMAISEKKWRSELQKLANMARDRGDFLAAAELYENVIALGKFSTGLLLAAGHMRKEGKDFPAAERHYLKVLELTPDDPEIHMQLGHFYKIVGRYKDAEKYYLSALTHNYPNAEEAMNEFRWVHDSEELRRENERVSPGDDLPIEGLVSQELLPRTLEQIQRDYGETFVISRLGNFQRTIWGTGQTVRGVDALRGHIISSIPCQRIEIFLNEKLIYVDDLKIVSLRWKKHDSDLRKYVFNAWIDFSRIPFGEYDLVFRATIMEGSPRRGIEWKRETVIVAEPIPEDDCVGSPAFIPSLDQDSSRSVVEQVNSLPSLVRRVSPSCYPGKLDNVAVMRLDQLGDMVVTLPTMRRLREMLPKSRIVGLLSPANAELASTLGVFDDIVVINFPDDKYQNQRVMSLQDQEAFIERLKPYDFDLAIDFLYSGHANKLLPLTGAPVTMTVARSDDVESLDVTFDARSPNGGYSLSSMSHTARVRAISEALALWLNNDAKPLPRKKSNAEQLARYGLTEQDRYVVLHTGSSFARFLLWPHYPELTFRLLEKGYKVLYMASDDSQKSKLPADALNDGRIIYLAKKIPFDDLDALLSCATLMVGNDSGPKHWASMRGTKVVSIHPGRDDLREWGQVFGGVVLARRVPCAGCGIRYDDTECGQDYACVRKVTVDEVMREAELLLSGN
ncbi:lipopolysaccharide core biosynthesis protein [Komagataeibacter europaeus]|uniref:Lipopolysaccharide core biosynthesis protein n=1 Tax=Komagataeibacter europaeus TaxID=33995 RepID=A0A0M0EG70_KOMEU|nr:glycosyltransferase family 9 protein [Komagataeibacter europaeus]KON64245.1 lipopolysaccharide core biosynthesis protein [Komagataeibacter europaeus]